MVAVITAQIKIPNGFYVDSKNVLIKRYRDDDSITFDGNPGYVLCTYLSAIT